MNTTFWNSPAPWPGHNPLPASCENCGGQDRRRGIKLGVGNRLRA